MVKVSLLKSIAGGRHAGVLHDVCNPLQYSKKFQKKMLCYVFPLRTARL